MRIVSTLFTSSVLVTTALVLAGCESGFDVNSPTDLTTGTSFHEILVEPGSNGIDLFEVNLTEYVRVSLVGLTGSNPQRPLDLTMGLRTGLFGETGCLATNPNHDLKVRPSFVAHQGPVLGSGAYCVEVYDIGELTEPVTALVRVVHPPPAGVSQVGTEVGGSNVTVGGASSRSFEVYGPGVTNITLTDLQPSVETGLGIGFQRIDETGCYLTRVITTTARTAPAHFSVPMDPGTYCVQVFDIGNYTRTTSYSFKVEHP